MKRGLLVLFIFLLTLTTVYAVEVTYSPLQDEALPGESVTYLLHVNNNEANALTIKLRSADLSWLLDQEDNQFTVAPGETKEYPLTFKPLSKEKIAPGTYGIKLLVSTQLTPLEKLITATVLSYNQVLDAHFVGQPEIDPRRSAILKLNVSNIRKIDLQNINIALSGTHFSYTRSLNLEKLQSEIIELPVKLDPSTVQGEYTEKIVISLKDHILLEKELSYTISQYEDVKEVTLPQDGFLVGGEIIQEVNEGNIQVTKTLTRTFNFLSYKFSSFDTKPTRVENTQDGYVVSWDLTLLPQSNVEVSYKVNYRTPVAIFILVILALFGLSYFRQRNSVVITKRVLAMHTETGSVRVMKVLLNLRNKGKVAVTNLRLIDKVPAVIKAPTQQGAYKPSQVQSNPQGTVLIWDLPSMRAGEEKIISYRIEGKINLLGKVTLPQAVVKYILLKRSVVARSASVPLTEKK